jgi:hypothetical protein
MKFTSMAWFLGVHLVAQKYNKGGHKGHLGHMLQARVCCTFYDGKHCFSNSQGMA